MITKLFEHIEDWEHEENRCAINIQRITPTTKPEEFDYILSQKTHDEDYYLIKKVLITPHGLIYDGFIKEKGNRILRDNEKNISNFIRVYFKYN